MLTKHVFLSEIQQNTYNPNKMTREKFADLVDEIKTAGYRQPILCREKNADGKYVIVDGEHRYKALLSLPEYADKKIPINIKICDDNDAKINTITMNRLHGNLDPYKVSALFKEMSTVYEMSELARMTKMSEAEVMHYLELRDMKVAPDESLRETGVVEDLRDEDDKGVVLNYSLSEEQDGLMVDAKSKQITVVGSDKDFIMTLVRFVNKSTV